jgi:hypothetical protein
MLIATLLFATATSLPPLPQLNTGAAPLSRISESTPFTFYVAGDNRPDKGDDLAPGFKGMITKMQDATSPAFILWGGDTVKGKKAADVPNQYPKVLAAFGQLKVPVFNIPGNHELDKKGEGDCNDAADPSGNLLAAYNQYMGPAYGVFYYGNSAFVGINTEDSLGNVPPPKGCFNGFVSATQLTQLLATLSTLANVPSISNIFLVMHRPVYDDNSHQMQPDDADQNTPYGKQLTAFLDEIKTLRSPKVTYVFASHDHRFYKVPSGGSGTPIFVVSGGAGAPLAGCDKDKGKPGAYYHWLRVVVRGTSVTMTVVPLTDTTPCGAPPG